MSLSRAIADAQRQAVPINKPFCAACQRPGLPILLLRSAYAPTPETLLRQHLTHDHGIAAVPLHADQLRILRQGYVYVLLDRRLWHAYQVTPEGALRQFPAFQPPREAGKPLATACRQQDHDVIASFINVNTDLYSTAWIAFANDPWPKTVLDQYQHAIANNDPDLTARFLELDLKAAREDPASVGIAMTETDLKLTPVLEYATATRGRFTSTHGLYLRFDRLAAMRLHIRTLVQREQLANGVLALTLPDPIGKVQELNAQRLGWVQALQEWRAEPQRHFEYFTSQALLGIRELNAAKAAAQAEEDLQREAREVETWNNNPLLAAKAHRPAVDIEAQTQGRIAREQQASRERLEERYDEAARAAFATAYDNEVQNRQRLIDQIAALYTEHYAARDFQRIALNDYAALDERTAEHFVRMMSACLAGGPTETPPEADGPLGATQRLWQRELENRDSLLYQALVAKHQPLLAELRNALASQDLGKVYDTVKSLIGSDEGQQLMVKPVREAIGQLLGATANAGNTLHQHLSAETRRMIGYLHSTALLRFAGLSMTQLIIPLRAGEYLKLLNEGLQARTDAVLGELDKQFRKPAERQVRAMVLSGAVTAMVSEKHGKVVELALWTVESADALQARLQHLQTGIGDSVDEALRSVRIGTDSLQYHATHSLRLLNLSAEQARTLARESMSSLRDGFSGLGPGRAGVLLSLGGLWFQQDSLRRNYEALSSTPGNAEPEALAAIWSSSVGVMGLGVEAVGGMLQVLRPNWKVGAKASTIAMGAQIVKFGGGLTAIAGVFDATQYFLASHRTNLQGDQFSKTTYTAAGLLAVGSATAGISTFMLGSAFLGPVGIAVILGLSAYAVATWAKNNESSELELWARQSKWGLPAKYRLWQCEADIDTAVGALNAALLGVTAHASLSIRFKETQHEQTAGPFIPIGSTYSIPLGLSADYKITIKNFSLEHGKYEWELKLYEPGATTPFITNADNSSSLIIASDENFAHQKTTSTLTIKDSLVIDDSQTASALELTLNYWPNKFDTTNFARLIIKQDKLDNQRHK